MKKRVIFYIIAVLTIVAASLLPVFTNVGSADEPAFQETGQIGGTEKTESISVTAARSVLIEAKSGLVLFGNREYEKSGMASTTKIMTALVVLNILPLDTVCTIPKEAVGVEGSSIYLVEGEKLTVEELLYGLLLASGNDCAVALALACSGSLDAFVDDMNKTAQELGLKDTRFTNPHGLSDENHYTSAYSLALLTAEALKNDTFREIVSTKKKQITYDGTPNQRWLTNHNKLLFSYEGMTGVKTGYTKATGRCLVTAAERDGVELVAVTLNDGNDWASHRNMLDYGFSQYKSVVLAEKGSVSSAVPVVGGKAQFVNAINTEKVSAVIKKSSGYTYKLVMPHFLYAPVNSGDMAGYAEYFDDNGVLFYRIPLIAAESVEIKKLSFFEKIFGSRKS